MVSWFRLLDSARNSLEVVAIARDYLATWTPEEIARLPAAVRPGRMRDERDVEELHERLVDEYRQSRATGAALESLQNLTSFMVRASIRMAELSGDARRGSGGSGDESPEPPMQAAPRLKR
jgi:hypothetical protein